MEKLFSSLRLSGPSGSANYDGLRSAGCLKKILLFSIGFSCMSVQGSWRVAVQRAASAARATVARTAVVTNMNRSLVTKPHVGNVAKKYSHSAYKNYGHQNNFRYWGMGAAVAAATLFVASGIGQCQAAEQPKTYKMPREDILKKFYAELAQKPWGDECKKYIEACKKHADKVNAEFCKLGGISHEDYHYYMKHFDNEWKKAEAEKIKIQQTEDVPTKLKEKIMYYLEYIGVEPNAIQAIQVNDDKGTMTSYHGYIAVSKDFTASSPCFEDVAIAHEMQHLLHSDSYMQAFYRFCLEGKGVDPKMIDSFIFQTLRFHEQRADVLSWLIDPKIAKDAADFCLSRRKKMMIEGELVDVWIDREDDEHPSDAHRYQTAMQLYADMTAASESKHK